MKRPLFQDSSTRWRARLRYHAGAASIDVIVADNVSTDSTAQIGRARGCDVVAIERRMIAAVQNGGAPAARGELLAFVDADTRIHPDTFNELIARSLTGASWEEPLASSSSGHRSA